jgi:hypothetical protein
MMRTPSRPSSYIGRSPLTIVTNHLLISSSRVIIIPSSLLLLLLSIAFASRISRVCSAAAACYRLCIDWLVMASAATVEHDGFIDTYSSVPCLTRQRKTSQ